MHRLRFPNSFLSFPGPVVLFPPTPPPAPSAPGALSVSGKVPRRALLSPARGEEPLDPDASKKQEI